MSTVPSRARLLALGFLALAIAGCGSGAHTRTQPPATHKESLAAATPAAKQTHHSKPHRTTARHAHHANPHRAHVAKPLARVHHAPAPKLPKDPASGVAGNGCAARTANLRRAIGVKLVPSDPAQAPALLARLQTLDIGGRSPLMPTTPKPPSVQEALDRAIVATRQWAGVLVIGPEDRQAAIARGNEMIADVAAVNAAARAAGLGDCVVPIS